MSVLPDVLFPGLKVVFCGTAVGLRSARAQAYYAGRGNKFWSVLYETGLTPVLLSPSDYASLPKYGIGLTDLAKLKFGSDNTLTTLDFDRDEFSDKIEANQPQYVCFNGKEAAKQFLLRSSVAFGLQKETIAQTQLFVAPSTSGAANGYWNVSYWRELASLCSPRT